MDESRFDALARALATPTSRRGVLRTLLGAATAGLAAGVGLSAARAQEAETDAARNGPFWRAGKRCNAPDRCGPRAPCTDGRCVPDSCLVGEDADDTVPANTTNPDNPCEFCSPTAAAWTGWGGTKGDGTACEVSGDAADPCLSNAGQCLDGVCVRDPLPNGELCGAGEVCCGGDCCTATQCCGESGSCEECGPHCTIGDDTPAEGTPNPDGSCTVCAPATDPFYWSTAPDDMRCGLDRSQFCCGGACQPEPCEPQCTIEGIPPVEADTVNLDNRCQICKPAENPSAWTTLPNKASCGTNPAQGRVCCSGVCCNVLQCCDAEGQCSNKCDPFCTILDEESGDPEEVPDGEPNLDNPCERCNIVANPNGWTKLDFPTPCGDAGQHRVCCVGICCAPGETCDSVTLSCVEDCSVRDGNRGDGSCEPAAEGCTIDGLVYPPGTINPAQDCQVCDPNATPTAWTARANDEICGPNGDRACCDGACCTGRGCCVPESGGICDIEYCGFTDPCAGMDPCGCTIGGAFHENGAPNPDNPCQYCNIGDSTTDWSPVSIAMCGPNQDQFCSGGVCCDLGICPDYATNTCGDYCSDVCVIGGVLYLGLDRNPANPCQHCAPPISHTSWSYVPPNWYCDPVAQTGACCFETCCGADSGCSDGGVCISFS